MCQVTDSAQSYLNYADSAPDVIEKEKCCGCAEEHLPEELQGYAHIGISKSGRFCVECIKYDQNEQQLLNQKPQQNDTTTN